jgi:hypothetical protein
MTTNDECYLKGPDCGSELWTCLACGLKFCIDRHSHVTVKGDNVECRYCALDRIAQETPRPDKELGVLRRLTEDIEKMDA